jgi:diamine N-acetyltransferase
MSAFIRPAYRQASAADIPAIAHQGQTAFLEAFGSSYTADEIASYFSRQFGPGVQEEEFASGQYVTFIAESTEGLIGHCKLGSFELPEGGPSVLGINRLYVCAKWHGKGVAGELLGLAIAKARRMGVSDLYLSCWTENPRARRFYERSGFAVVGTCHFQMGNRVDTDYLMQLHLQ